MKDHIDEIIDKSMKKTEIIEKELKSIEEKFGLDSFVPLCDDGNHKSSVYLLDGEEVSRK